MVNEPSVFEPLKFYCIQVFFFASVCILMYRYNGNICCTWKFSKYLCLISVEINRAGPKQRGEQQESLIHYNTPAESTNLWDKTV